MTRNPSAQQLAQARPEVSVIIPAYNAELFIDDCLQSLIAQTHSNWEAIVVDDGSTDHTAEIVHHHVARDNRIAYVFQQNGRQGKARNTGLAHARGPLVAFLDADDLWEPEKLARQTAIMEKTGADVVYSDAVIFDSDKTRDDVNFKVRTGRMSGTEMLDHLLRQNTIPVASVLMRRSTLDAAGGFEEQLQYQSCEDYDLWLKAAENGAVFFGMPDKLVRYRRHSGASTCRESNVLRPMLCVVSRHIGRGNLSARVKKTRIRNLYRQTVAALLAEGQRAQATSYLDELAVWDRGGIVTSIQKVLFKLSPKSFNFVSRECLYRIEWHLGRLLGNTP